MSDPIKTIGELLTGTEQRDCVHFALLPVCAAEKLYPSQKVQFRHGCTTHVISAEYGTPIGILSPFLPTHYIKPGQWVWMILMPGSVTGMTHHWHHPVVDAALSLPESEEEQWLHAFADKWHFAYDEMLSGAQDEEGYVVAGGRDLHSASDLDAGDEERFWQCIEIVTKKRFNKEHRDQFGWSCSC